MIEELRALVGDRHVLTGSDMDRYATDWTGAHVGTPIAVARPAETAEVAAVVRLAAAKRCPIVPIGGNTGLCGGTYADNALMLSLERLNRIREIRAPARWAAVEGGVVLSALHDAIAHHGLTFPMRFGAQESCMIGGCLSTNAGGSNVLRYGNMRALCLGLEAVLPNGEVLDAMTALRKDNSGYALKDLLVGAEGTLGVITAAVLKLAPIPRARATALVAASSVDAAMQLLNTIQDETGGAVEAFEYMRRGYMEALAYHFPQLTVPFEQSHEVNLLLELATHRAGDAQPDPDGSLPIVSQLEGMLADGLESGTVVEAFVARNEEQRARIWQLREISAEVSRLSGPYIGCDIAVPLDGMGSFIERMDARLGALDPDARTLGVAHLGDGNIHYTIVPGRHDQPWRERIIEAVEEVALSLGGSFSAEHGIGRSKLASMARHKPPVALDAMRRIKRALDPDGIMNPGKLIPPPTGERLTTLSTHPDNQRT